MYAMARRDNIDADVEQVMNMGEAARSIVEPDLKGFMPSTEITGAHKKHYQYDFYDEVSVDLFANGALLRNLGSAYEWYGKAKVKKCFEKAKMLGNRSKQLNGMFR